MKQTKSQEQNQIKDHMHGLYQLNVWNIFTPLAAKMKAINLGQGYPQWKPPKFYLQALKQSLLTYNPQYAPSNGSQQILKAVANYHQKDFGSINYQNQVLVTNGASQALNCCLLGFLDQGDQIIVFDPFFDFYKPTSQIVGGIIKSVPLKPIKKITKQDIIRRTNNFEKQIQYVPEQDEWIIDFECLKKTLNQKTKLIIINSPQNPLGKIFTFQQLKQIAIILQKYPKVLVVQDNVYDTMTFDLNLSKPVPKISLIESMKKRSVNIFSGGKLFSATGVKIGWIVTHQSLIKYLRSAHQYSLFCLNNLLQKAISKSLQAITNIELTYNQQCAKRLMKNRNNLIKQLYNSKYNFMICIPPAGYFVLADISKCQVMQKYMVDEKGQKRTKDYAFSTQLIYENGVATIPCSSFFGPQNRKQGQNYIRFALCKNQQSIIEAGKRL